jgi:hypothetical protein
VDRGDHERVLRVGRAQFCSDSARK